MSTEQFIEPDYDLDLSYLGMVKHPKTGTWVTKDKVKFYDHINRVNKRLELKAIKKVIFKQLLESNTGYMEE